MSVRQILDPSGKIAASYLPAFIQNDLAAPVVIQPEAPATSGNAAIYVPGDTASPLGGSITLVPGSRTGAPAPDGGLTINAQPTGVQVYVGANAQATNLLQIAGASGLSQVYDQTYNQPVALRAITMVNQNVSITRDPANTSEILRCVQAGVATIDAGGVGVFNTFTVPRTGFYSMQASYSVQNENSPAATTINIPISGVEYGSLAINLVQGGTVVPYSSYEVVGTQFISQDITLQGGGVNVNSINMVRLTAATNYAVYLNVRRPAGSTAWNIGASGTIKVELVAMC